MMYFIIVGAMSLIGMYVQGKLKRKFARYGQIRTTSGMSGKEVAESMLRHYGINDVQVRMSKGFLSDHYNPANKTVNLSPQVFEKRTIAAAAVAAHECGHAVQHNTAYSMLKMRSALVPFVKVAAFAQQGLILAALGMAGSFPQLLPIVLLAFGITTLFSFITLPVEFDASKRALVWLDETGTTKGAEYDGAKDALWWAAMTYVAQALTSLVILLYMFLRFSR